MTTTTTTTDTNPRDLIGRVFQLDGCLDRVVDVRELVGQHWAIVERVGPTWASIACVEIDRLAGKEVAVSLWVSAKRVVDAHVQRRADAQAFGVRVEIVVGPVENQKPYGEAVIVRSTKTAFVDSRGDKWDRECGWYRVRNSKRRIRPDDLADLQQRCNGRDAVDFVREGKRAAEGKP
jgi:hypothetical protein